MPIHPHEPDADKLPIPADLPVDPDDGAGQPVGMPLDPQSDQPIEPPR